MPFLTTISGIIAIEVQVKINIVGEQSRGHSRSKDLYLDRDTSQECINEDILCMSSPVRVK
jgi:hypothetical protein